MDTEQTQLDAYTNSTIGLSKKQKDLIEAVRELGDQLNRKPTLSEVKERFGHTRRTYRYHFGSWSDALEYTQFEPGDRIDEDDLLSEIRRVGEELGKVPRINDFRQRGKYSHGTYTDRFRSWNAALEKAGFDLSQDVDDWSGRVIPTGVLIDEMLRVAEIVDRPPKQTDMREVGKFSVGPYKRRFGSWGEAHEFAGLPARKAIAATAEDDGVSEEYGRNWQNERGKALDRDRWCCQSCGMGQDEHVEKFGNSLEVHHIIPISEFDEPEEANFGENLITLCRPCHVRWENIRRSEERSGGEFL